MKMTTDHIRYVAALQDFGEPQAALYVSVPNRQLYLLIRVENDDVEPEVNPWFATAEIQPAEVEQYMSRKTTLSQLLKNKSLCMVSFNGRNMTVEYEKIPNMKESIEEVDEFDPDYCEDDFWIRTFLNRLKNDQPLEVVHS